MRDILKHLKVFVRSYRVFKETFDTPLEGSLSLRWLYILTNGWFNDIFQFFYSLKHPMRPVRLPYQSLMPGYSEELVRKAVAGLRKDGIYVFEQRLPESLVDELYNYARVTPSLHQTAAGTGKELGSPFDPDNIVATNYRIPERLVVNNPAAQRLLADPVIVRVAQEYLGSQIRFSNQHMWWTTPKDCDKPASHLAQLFHFDMDRIKFMKFFVYLTDVDSNSGPHCAVKGSCARKPKCASRTGVIPTRNSPSNIRPIGLSRSLDRVGVC